MDEAFWVDEEQNVRGRQMENKSLSVIAAQENRDASGAFRASHPRRFGREPQTVYRGSHLARQCCPNRRQGRILSAERISVGAAAASSYHGVSAEGLAARHGSERDQERASGLLRTSSRFGSFDGIRAAGESFLAHRRESRRRGPDAISVDCEIYSAAVIRDHNIQHFAHRHEPKKQYWSGLAQSYDSLGPPLRPSIVDLEIMQKAIVAQCTMIPHGRLHALMLGVTPDIAVMNCSALGSC